MIQAKVPSRRRRKERIHRNLRKAIEHTEMQAKHLQYWVEWTNTDPKWQAGCALLNEWRFQSRMTLDDFARHTNIEPMWLQERIVCKGIPGHKIFQQLCKRLNMRPMELLGTACKRNECMAWHTNPEDR